MHPLLFPCEVFNTLSNVHAVGRNTSVLNLIRRYILVHTILFISLVWIGGEKHHEIFANSHSFINNTNIDTTWPTSVLLQSMIANYSDDSEKILRIYLKRRADRKDPMPFNKLNMTQKLSAKYI